MDFHQQEYENDYFQYMLALENKYFQEEIEPEMRPNFDDRIRKLSVRWISRIANNKYFFSPVIFLSQFNFFFYLNDASRALQLFLYEKFSKKIFFVQKKILIISHSHLIISGLIRSASLSL